MKYWLLAGVAFYACTGAHERGDGPAPPDTMSVATDAGTSRAGDTAQQPVDAAHDQLVDAAQAQAVDAAQAADAAQRVDAAGLPAPSDAPLICRFCKTAPPAGPSDFFGPMCSTPNAPLDAAQRARFRIDEVIAAMSKPFSQALTWGTVSDDGAGLSKRASETRIEGDVMLGDFVYHACSESVTAIATVRFATADGQLRATVRGDMKLKADALGWPKGATPEIDILAFDDLSTARGALDLGADPNKLVLGELIFSLTRASEGDRGFVRVRRTEFPDQAALNAAHVVTDTPSSRDIHEVATGVFPLDRCNGRGWPFDGDAPSGALGGGTWRELLVQAWTRLGSPHTVSAKWQVSGKLTSVQVELGQLPMTVCANGWSAQFTTTGRVRSADGVGDHPLTIGQIVAEPYTTTLSVLTLQDPNLMAELTLPAPAGAASAGSMLRDDAEHIVIDTLIWPPTQ